MTREAFTVHAGKYLVGTHLERTFRGCRVWIPSKDAGIDLLLTDASCSRAVPLQVKYSRDYSDSSPVNPAFPGITRSSFLSVQRQKIEDITSAILDRRAPFVYLEESPALSHHHTERAFEPYRGPSLCAYTYRLYFCVVGEAKCWELRCPVAEKRND